MDADASLLEPLAAETPTEAKVTAQPTTSMSTRSRFIIVIFLLTLNLFLAASLSFLNALSLMQDKITIRTSSMYGPIFKFIFGLDVQIHQVLSIFVLGLTLGLVVLTSTGHLNVKVIILMPVVTGYLFGISGLYAVAYELYAVMVSGPSKLRSEMLYILGYEFIGYYAIFLSSASSLHTSFTRKSTMKGVKFRGLSLLFFLGLQRLQTLTLPTC